VFDGPTEQVEQNVDDRTRELARANQELKNEIAAHRRTEERLSQLAAIVESSDDAIIGTTLDGAIVSWNAGAESIYGYSVSEVVGRPIDILVPPDQPHEIPRILEKLKRGEKIPLFETVRIGKGGQRVDVSVAISPVKDANGKIVGASAIDRNITERKNAEERFYKAFHASPEPITIATVSEGLYVDVNESFLRLTGYRRDEVIGRTSLELNFWDRAEDRAKLVEILNKEGRVRDLEITFLTKSGEQHTGLDSAEVMEVAGQKCIIAFFKDITEQKLLEKRLRQAQKMEAIGQLSGGIAHDFNNLLMVIIGYSELLEEGLPQGDPLHRKCEQIKKAGLSAVSLTRQLLAFSRQQMLEPKALDLNAVILDVETMLRRLIGEDIELRTALGPGLGRVKADQGQIEQVIINLVVNARDAMPKGGKVTIETANVDLDEDFARRHPPQLPGPYVLLAVSDAGIGMDAETQARIFEPFFTTKELGKGTGLGLSTVYGVVKQSGGFIWVYSELEEGTVFKIYFPCIEEAVRVEKPTIGSTGSLRGTETILLVEDQEALRELTRSLLAGSGYTVLEAEGPDKAVDIAKQHSGPIHLLLTDMVMPGMNGRELAERLAPIRPEMRAVYMSGYTRFTHTELLDFNAPLLTKPFTRDALSAKVREVLDTNVSLNSNVDL